MGESSVRKVFEEACLKYAAYTGRTPWLMMLTMPNMLLSSSPTRGLFGP